MNETEQGDRPIYTINFLVYLYTFLLLLIDNFSRLTLLIINFNKIKDNSTVPAMPNLLCIVKRATDGTDTFDGQISSFSFFNLSTIQLGWLHSFARTVALLSSRRDSVSFNYCYG